MSEAAQPSAVAHANRQAVIYCPYCGEETLFPLETAAGNAAAASGRSP